MALQVRTQSLISRIPWRLLVAFLGGALVINGASRIVGADLTATSESFILLVKHGMGMVIAGAMLLIGVILSR